MKTISSALQTKISAAAGKIAAAALCMFTCAVLAACPVHAEPAEEALAAVRADAAARAAAPAIAAPMEPAADVPADPAAVLPADPAAAIPAEPAPEAAPELNPAADPALGLPSGPVILTESGTAQIAPGVWLTAYNYPGIVPATAEALAAQTQSPIWAGPVLTKSAGAVNGPSGREVYYNLDMAVIVDKMHSLGYAAEYWVRPDGVKMFGPFVMVAAGYDVHPLGSLVETSVGTAMVVDTGGFAKTDPYLIDIATVW